MALEEMGRFRPSIGMFYRISFEVLKPRFGITYSKAGVVSLLERKQKVSLSALTLMFQ